MAPIFTGPPGVGVGVAVGVAVAVGVGVAVGAAVAVGVGVAVSMGVAVGATVKVVGGGADVVGAAPFPPQAASTGTINTRARTKGTNLHERPFLQVILFLL
jgi:hypothetical protein